MTKDLTVEIQGDIIRKALVEALHSLGKNAKIEFSLDDYNRILEIKCVYPSSDPEKIIFTNSYGMVAHMGHSIGDQMLLDILKNIPEFMKKARGIQT